MAIFDRSYRRYPGELTPVWSRFLVPARYALQDAFKSRIFLAFFLSGFLWPLVCGVVIYLRYNSEALAVLDISLGDLLQIDAIMFRDFFMNVQAGFAFAVVLILGPALVSPDLRNNALPLYLARPIKKRDYVLGKLAVLALLLSAVTWVPGTLLFVLQASLQGGGWWQENFRALPGMFIGFWVWILVLALLSLAISAFVKWKPLARLVFLGSILVMSGMGESFNQLYDTWKGSFLDLNALRDTVWNQLFGVAETGMPTWSAWLGLAAVCGFSIWLLSKRLEAYEVVK